ncbi:MAG: molybdopterin-guanine dinucleotide biosynthesis protein B [gamma proteobacterium endosymbiont of Lamellibrachia anaximandri]|nr:molybdopterin-guanine dinucleotide biosynthesis protein B [gamma proteobacterium endosymbiont of Lamellibrachia anaximandri]MBL3534963.1 molybdopterin-guanine dinucleotide biosynthesis protein B [gamma proteobacterium endosymbiont of Lamellibrachia anaximandri]
MIQAAVPVLGFAAYSGTGKTTLLTRLIPLLKAEGIRIGVIKHAHHKVDVDKPGKDSYELRKAGAGQVLLATAQRWALMVEEEIEGDPDLQTMLDRLDASRLDLILVEGFRHVRFPKIELHRPVMGRPLLCLEDPSIVAVASDEPLPVPLTLPQLDINDVPAIRDFILFKYLQPISHE